MIVKRYKCILKKKITKNNNDYQSLTVKTME